MADGSGDDGKIGRATGLDLPKKRQRVDDSPPATVPEGSVLPRSSETQPPLGSGGVFNDSATADVILCLILDQHFRTSSDPIIVDHCNRHLYLHADVLRRRSPYFSALLSDRWQQKDESSGNAVKFRRLHHIVPPTIDSFKHYIAVIELFYSDDLMPSINSVSTAISFLPIALEILFEDCVQACIKFLEAVPWSEDEERRIMTLIPTLGKEESKELLARVSVEKKNSAEEMLDGLILSATKSHPNMAFAKAFVAKLLRDVTSKESARKVLDSAFEKSLRFLKVSVEEYASPNLRGDQHETEAFQRLNLHKAVTTAKHLLWLVERMIELGVADSAVRAWSEQASLTADLQRALHDDMWKNTVPSLPTVVLRCTSRLAGAVSTGSILVARQVRMKLVNHWLPVLIICRDSGSRSSPMGNNHKSLSLELEEIFLKIISTLPMAEAQDLLQKCLSFSTRNVDDCPHLVAAFTTWFRRAKSPSVPDGPSLEKEVCQTETTDEAV